MKTLEQRRRTTAKRIITRKNIKTIHDLCRYLNEREEYPSWAEDMIEELGFEVLDSTYDICRNSAGETLQFSETGGIVVR